MAFAVAACGGSDNDRTVEAAIEAGKVSGVGKFGATSAECDDGTPMTVGGQKGRLHKCTAETASGSVRLSCGTFEGDDRAYCVKLGPAPGEPVFTTAEQRAAPKVVTWKCEDVDDMGRQIGPAFVSLRNARPGSPVDEREWMSKQDAQKLAKRLNAEFGVDC